jgi:hypothetical protein
LGLNGNGNSGLNSGGGDEGDWFTEQQKDRQLYAKHVSPLREWCFEGEVTAAMSDHGYIDGEVYFRMDACLNGYRPRKWDAVRVGAIESNQGKCKWRAVYVVPTTSDSSAFRNNPR